ncbi:MAG TPA: hypothetical protein VGF16_07665 [Bryobacteraceae bacterium]|jgi:hypothetical protein
MRKAVVLLLAGMVLLCGQAPQMSAERRQAIMDYPLNLQRANQLITVMKAMTQYVVGLPDFQERMRKSLTMTPAEQLAAIEKDPKAAAILKQNDLTARDCVIGVPALRMALLAAQGVTGPNTIASPANIAFAKANMAELKPKMDAADGATARK